MSVAAVDRLADADFTLPFGTVRAIRSEWVLASGPAARIGAYCQIEGSTPGSSGTTIGEVVAIDDDGLRLVPLGPVSGIRRGARVTLAQQDIPRPDLAAITGRAVDALARPIDGGPAIATPAGKGEADYRLNPLDRATPNKRLVTGIRSIDGLLPLAQGQKIGIFAPSGAGKSSLLEQLCAQTQCDRVILCQIGERGREVEKAWRLLKSSNSDRKYTLIAAGADESPSMRVRALDLAIALAEQARAAGEHVLLSVDSVTRVAMALRELGIAGGEPPSARGYTANVFSHLPRQVERCGAARDGGAITTVLSVLSETEDVDDPIVEMMKSVLDGHIVLSRSLAEKRHFPAIDISRSVSRLADDISSEDQTRLATAIYRLHADYEEARPMIDSGIYTPGSKAEIDRAIQAREPIEQFLRQPRSQSSAFDQTMSALQSLGASHGG